MCFSYFLDDTNKSLVEKKRQLRWIFTGIGLSLVPYFVYILYLWFTNNIISYGPNAPILLSSISFSLFPIFVGIGIWKYRIIDLAVCRFLNYFFTFFILATLLIGMASAIAFLPWVIFLHPESMGVYSLLVS